MRFNARHRYRMTTRSLVCLGVLAFLFGPAMATANTAAAASGTPPMAYVLNTNDGTLSLVDTATDTTEGSPIAWEGLTATDIALTPDGMYGYFTDNQTNTVTVFDTATNAVVGSPITVGNGAHGVAISPDGSIAYVTNFGDNTVSMIDTATNTVVGNPDPSWSRPNGHCCLA